MVMNCAKQRRSAAAIVLALARFSVVHGKGTVFVSQNTLTFVIKRVMGVASDKGRAYPIFCIQSEQASQPKW